MNIKDYLHLYLGCEVQYPSTIEGKIIKATLTGFSREDGVETTYKQKKDGCVGDYLAWKENGSHSCNAFNIKPILRPLSDMTEESSESILDEICEAIGVEPHLYYQAYGDILLLLNGNTEEVSLTIGANEMAEIVRTLCKHSIDIFGLIDAGLAIKK